MELPQLMDINAKLTVIATSQFMIMGILLVAFEEKISEERNKEICEYITRAQQLLSNINGIESKE